MVPSFSVAKNALNQLKISRLNIQVALQLAGLQAQVIIGDPHHGNTELYSKVDMFIPQRIRSSRLEILFFLSISSKDMEIRVGPDIQ